MLDINKPDAMERCVPEPEGNRHICETFARPGFVRAGAVIRTDPEGRVQSLFVNSSSLGTLEIDRTGALTCHSWETEDQAKSASYLARCYPVILHNGSEDHSFALRILSDVCTTLGRDDIRELAEQLLRREESVRYGPR